MNEAPILFERRGAVGLITLNRPKALNALTHFMCLAMAKHLEECARDDGVRAVVVRGAGGRAFCAGGDMRSVWESARDRTSYARNFFRDEYRLNRAIKRFPKPYIALMHGIVMGGGAGVSVHGSHRVADGTLDFAMPETGIGMFPDVGASWFLSRAPGELGLYLALTGARLGVADAFYAGMATHFVPAARWGSLLERLAAGEAPNDVLAASAEDSGPAPLAAHRVELDTAFAADSAEDAIERFERMGAEWGRDVAQIIRARSPLATKIAFREIRAGEKIDFDACMAMEFAIASRIIATHDFAEGIRAALIDKDRVPKWHPPSFADVGDEKISEFFAPVQGAGL